MRANHNQTSLDMAGRLHCSQTFLCRTGIAGFLHLVEKPSDTTVRPFLIDDRSLKYVNPPKPVKAGPLSRQSLDRQHAIAMKEEQRQYVLSDGFTVNGPMRPPEIKRLEKVTDSHPLMPFPIPIH